MGLTISCGRPGTDPGRVVMHRLNRVEYDNTVRDLLGTELTPARAFPPDDAVAGFDNVAANLSTSPLHVEMYELAAATLADEAVGRLRFDGESRRQQAESELAEGTIGGPVGDYWGLWAAGQVTVPIDVALPGTYRVEVRAAQDAAGPEPASMALLVDDVVQEVFTVTAELDSPEVYAVQVELAAGTRFFTAAFLNDYYDYASKADRNLWVDWFQISGPVGFDPSQSPLVECDPAVVGELECAHEVVAGLAPRAFRRPLADEELERLDALLRRVLSQGGSADDAIRYGLMALLTSPHFLYRVEVVGRPDSSAPVLLNGYEIASRLSYFLWSSMPDERLFEAARAGDLSTSDGIAQEVQRMLLDPKASALVDNFGGQWLFIRGIDDAFKDPNVYPQLDNALRASMKEEMTQFFETFVFGDRDMRELLTASEGSLDRRLAEHYGVPPQPGKGWHDADLSAVERGGLLGQAGFLSVASYPARTSPVIRGKFVLGQLLCDAPPPPPPGVEGIDEKSAATTLREQLERHRADPSCAACHVVMDEVGFSLEHFDAIGQLRASDRGLPVDNTGTLPDGTPFTGARELGAVVAADPRYPRCIAEKLFTYGVGRVPGDADDPRLDAIVERFAEGGYRFGALAAAIATDDAFRMTTGEAP